MFVLLLRILVPLGCQLKQKHHYALFLLESDLKLAHLLIFDEFFQFEESLLEVGLDELQDFEVRLLLGLERLRCEGVVVLVPRCTTWFALELA